MEYEKNSGKESVIDGVDFNSLGHSVLILDRDQIIHEANAAALSKFSRDGGGVLGNPCYDAIHCPHHHTDNCPCLKALETGKNATTRLTMNGSGEEYVISCTPLKNKEGEVERIIHLMVESDGFRPTEERQRQEEKMQAMETFVGGLCHKLNNMMTAIMGSAELAMQETDQDFAARQELMQILKSTQSAAAMTRQLAVLARRNIPDRYPMDLDEYCGELEHKLAELKQEGYDTELHVDTHRYVLATHSMLDEIFSHLIKNSRQAMPKGGRLTIRISQTAHPANPAQHFIRFTVEDNGHGMDAVTLSRATEPFFSTKNLAERDGLGLSIVRGYVYQSGGRMEIKSRPKQGTRVDFYLPEARSEQREPTQEPVRKRGRTILLVEDEAVLRQVGRTFLEKSGYRVLDAADGLQALNQARKLDDPIDLVIADVVMPNMSGPEVVEQLKDLKPGFQVIYTSGYTEDRHFNQMCQKEKIPFIPKPYAITSLMDEVNRILQPN